MTTVDPDTLERDPEVLRDIGRPLPRLPGAQRGRRASSTIAIGDPVTLRRPH